MAVFWVLSVFQGTRLSSRARCSAWQQHELLHELTNVVPAIWKWPDLVTWVGARRVEFGGWFGVWELNVVIGGLYNGALSEGSIHGAGGSGMRANPRPPPLRRSAAVTAP